MPRGHPELSIDTANLHRLKTMKHEIPADILDVKTKIVTVILYFTMTNLLRFCEWHFSCIRTNSVPIGIAHRLQQWRLQVFLHAFALNLQWSSHEALRLVDSVN